LERYGISLHRSNIRVLQVNIGKRCNQTCVHCHVNAGPNAKENMDRMTIDRILELLSGEPELETVDITGGAPELNPHFQYFVAKLRSMNRKVILRCNLTVLFEPGQEGTPGFLAENQVQITASLPCYLEENVNQQRGAGSFRKSILALKILNGLGYGGEGTGLGLDLVYNPIGASLPPEQTALEIEYRQHLKQNYGIRFNHLLTVTNIPINRYAHYLQSQGKLETYREMLTDHFNPRAATRVMCRSLLSVSWDGKLYDCDFNQALQVPIGDKVTTIWDIEGFTAVDSRIAFGDHCFACTAGYGSSCRGALT
jgi:radical SAM/Cys-rich protein